jgi:hypothetical protein
MQPIGAKSPHHSGCGNLGLASNHENDDRAAACLETAQRRTVPAECTQNDVPIQNLWRGDLSPIGCAAVANPRDTVSLMIRAKGSGVAIQPIGDKSPHHRGFGLANNHEDDDERAAAYLGTEQRRTVTAECPQSAVPIQNLWRGDLSPIGCAAVANPRDTVSLMIRAKKFGVTIQLIGDKSPHHRGCGNLGLANNHEDDDRAAARLGTA